MLDHPTTEVDEVSAATKLHRLASELEALDDVERVDTDQIGQNTLTFKTYMRDLTNDVMVVLAERDARIARESEAGRGEWLALIET